MTGVSGNSQPRAIAQVIFSLRTLPHSPPATGTLAKAAVVKKLSIHSSAESCVYDQGWMYQEEMGNQG